MLNPCLGNIHIFFMRYFTIKMFFRLKSPSVKREKITFGFVTVKASNLKNHFPKERIEENTREEGMNALNTEGLWD